jgi:DNA-binding transcriptional regulator YhcF (GntR family)
MSKGERLASEIELQIANGNIQPGEKLGSIREVSRHKGVAVNTVLRAY